MNIADNDLTSENFGSEDRRELSLLFDCLHDEVISDEQCARLNVLLDESIPARKYYLSYIALCCQLARSAGSHERVSVADINQLVASLAVVDDFQPSHLRVPSVELSSRAPKKLPARPWRRISYAGIGLALAATIMISLTAWLSKYDPHELSLVRQTAADQESLIAKTRDLPFEQPAATISYASQTSRLGGSNQSPALMSAIKPGQAINLLQGEIELKYQSGTKLLLIGPAEFLVKSEGGTLARGGLIASVTEAGHGFTIETLHGKVVDLGTEFGVAVDDFGVSEVSVFSGKVEAFPAARKNGATEKIELTQGHGLQWNGNASIALEADRRRFFSASIRGESVEFEPATNASIDSASIDSGLLDNRQWKTLGNVSSSSNSLVLQGNTNAPQLPHIISTKEFDPSQGPITVSCVVKFADLKQHEAASLAILTRSENKLGTAPSPWNGALASSIRCSLDREAGKSEGVLAAGVKLEHDRELSRISWRGFGPIEEGTPYRLEMRDDGVNVVFTVTRLDNPSVKKTVSFRSLFRGQKNYVAIEGPRSETVVIDQLEVVQQLPMNALVVHTSSEVAAQVSGNGQGTELTVEHLKGLVSDDAILVVEDSFADDLDPEIWTTLDEVFVEHGTVQLGMPNAKSHIDTWKPRPYLLTKRRFDPSDGKLTIIGKVRFAENFVNGYGASFAVMTRAENIHGSGPGWENSVLRTGVRSNFWPAAWDYEHSLEIHEKPEPNTITLLATQGLQIDSQARSYLFCIVDDGQSATLTIIDAKNQAVKKSISTPTSVRIKSGHIGFEACWGSPIALDDIRIYQNLRHWSD